MEAIHGLPVRLAAHGLCQDGFVAYMPKSHQTLRAVAIAAVAGVALVPALGSAPGRAETYESRIAAAEANLGALQEEIAAATGQLTDAQRRLESIRVAMADAEGRVERLARKMLGARNRAGDLARELYMGGGVESVEAVLASESLADAETRVQYLNKSQEAYLSAFERLARDRAEINRNLDELDEAREEVGRVADQAAEIRARLVQDAEAQRAEIEELRAAAALAQQERAERLAAAAAEAEAAAAAAAAQAAAVEEESDEVTSPAPPPPSGEVNWDAIAQCESSGNWHLDSTYDGGLQFHPDTWLGYGGGQYARYAWQASREQQIAIAEVVLDAQGPEAWPNCFQYG